MAGGVYIKKYEGTNYFYDRAFVDSIKLESVLDNGFPIFFWDTEKTYEQGDRLGLATVGDFSIKISLISPVKSNAGKTVKEFFLPVDDFTDYFYLVIVIWGDHEYSGIVRQSHISGAFTYSQGDYYLDIWAFGVLKDFSDRVKRSPVSSLNFGNGDIKTFEEYIHFHFSGMTAGVVDIGLPQQSYLSKLTAYGNPAGVWAYGDYWGFINDKSNIDRWETFRELARGIGFNCSMRLSPGTEVLNEPEFIFNIFFLTDIANEAPKRIERVIKHNQSWTRTVGKWLYLQYRTFSFDNDETYSNGIISSINSFYDSDADNAHDVLYPCFIPAVKGKLLNYDNGTYSLLQVYKDVEFLEYELKQYPYNTSSGAPLGKLMPPTQSGVNSVGMAYSKIFNAATGTGTNFDRYDNKPIQRFAAANYKRYIKGWSREKEIVVSIDPYNPYKIWQSVVIDEGAGDELYFISSIRDFDILNRTCELRLNKL